MPPERRAAIYHSYCMGASFIDLADREGVTDRTIRNIVNEQRELQRNMPKNCIVAGDRRNGRLISTPDPHRYEGTCVVGGKAHSKSFVAANARKAEEAWRKWCENLRDERAFLDMVERKGPDADVAPDPELDENAAQRGETEVEEPRTIDKHEQEDEDMQATMDKPVYIIWAKTEKPSLYGAFRSMDVALKKVDELNDVAAFLGSDSPFEVEEVEWKK